jgi:hypothetical protein
VERWAIGGGYYVRTTLMARLIGKRAWTMDQK